MNQPLSQRVAPLRCDTLQSGQWRATLDIDLQRRGDVTRLVGCSHEGPLYVQKPFYPEAPDCAHVYLLHPPGGIVSGDHLEVKVAVGADAAALLTTPGAARAYRSRDDDSLQYQSIRLAAGKGGSIEWFPLETIVYDGASARVETEVHLATGAHCVLWELTCLGLPASGEPFRHGSFRQRYRVYREGMPVFIDGFALGDDNRERMAGAGALRGQPVNGFFLLGPLSSDTAGVHSGGDAEAELKALRDAVPGELQRQVSITRLGDFYVGRYLGDSAERGRAQFVRWWQILRPRLSGRRACPPRIWLT